MYGFPEGLEICLIWLWDEDKAMLGVWWAEEGSKHNVRFGKTQKHHAKTFCLHFKVPVPTQKPSTENLLLLTSVLGTRDMMVNNTD